jgi:acetyl esterase
LFGADPERIAVAGDSAGGTMTAIIADELKSQVKLAISIYPSTTHGRLTRSVIENADAPVLTVKTMNWFNLLHYRSPGDLFHPLSTPFARPPLIKGGIFPRVHVITAELDVLRDEGFLYVNYLEEAGVNVTHRFYPNTPHAFFGSSIFPHGRESLQDVCDLIRNEL